MLFHGVAHGPAQFGADRQRVYHAQGRDTNHLEVGRTVDVIPRVDQPVRIEHHNGVHPQRAAAAANLDVAVNRGLATAFLRAVQLAQIHGRDVGDFGGQR